ncbi:GABA-A receptor [Aureococcus anophagefferens]|nr:GABA-A receptor [Aureococcus anophagefferens]
MLSTLEATPHEKCSPTFSRAGSTMTQWDSKAADEDQPSPKLGSPEARASERGSQRLKAAVRDHIEETRRVKRGKRIRVGYKINGIRNVNSIDCTFTIDFKVFYYWTDYRVKGRPKGTVVDIHEPDLFQPELIISNEAELSLTHWEFQVKDPKTGLLKLSEYYRGKLLIPNMSLHFFPFDVQNLRICIKPHKKTIDEVYSSLHIIVLVERESDWHIRMIMLPILLIAVCSLCCFAFGVDDIAGRMETAVALMLTNVATKFTITDYMPKVPYRTLCDFYLDVCFFCQFGVTLSNAAIFILYRALPKYAVTLPVVGGTHRVVHIANAACAALAAYVLLKLNAHTFFRLDAHRKDVEEWRKQALPASSPPAEHETDGVKLGNNGEATAAGRLRHLFAGAARPSGKSDRRVAPGQSSASLSVHMGAENLEPRGVDALPARKSPAMLLTPSNSKAFKSTPKIGSTGFAAESFKDYGDYMRDHGFDPADGDDDAGDDDNAPAPAPSGDAADDDLSVNTTACGSYAFVRKAGGDASRGSLNNGSQPGSKANLDSAPGSNANLNKGASEAVLEA